MEEKGISPIIATILLIAVTAVAAGVIASYVAGLYVFTPTIIKGTADATVFDYDNDAATENFKNGNIVIVVTLTSGRLRNVGDPSYGGTTVTVTDAITGFSAAVSFDNTDDWGGTMTKTSTTTFGGENFVMKVTMYPSTTGRIGTDSPITIQLYPEGCPNAHENNALERKVENVVAWQDGDPMTISITGRDSLTVDIYSLYGRTWAE